MNHLALVAIVVADYDGAIDYYTSVLGFRLVEDEPREPGKRWVVVAPSTERGAMLLLAKAAKPEQLSRVGNQTGGRVFLFLHTTDFDGDYRRFKSAGVRFIEEPRSEPYGRVVVFVDLYGNKWDLIERKQGPE
jgi:catechol 2,3-dioxygenase-like lactoylglutathione lyase family enzyme